LVVLILPKIGFFALVIQLPEKCDYYRWQKAYLVELIDVGLIQVQQSEGGRGEDEAESGGMAPTVPAKNLQQKHPMENQMADGVCSDVIGCVGCRISWCCFRLHVEAVGR
jgi:hypothetical protein